MKLSYISHCGRIPQGEADDLCSCCVDVFIPYEGQVVGERLHVPKHHTEMTQEVNKKKHKKSLNI